MLKFYVLLIFAAVYVSANPAIIWNIKENELPPASLDKLVSKASENIPVIVFQFKDFDLAQFSKHASVYDKSTTGGDLKNLKTVIDSSKGFSIKNDEIPDDFLSSSSSVTEFDRTDEQDLSKSSIILVHINSWKDLDSLPSEVIQRVGRRNYVAILIKPSVSRPKREALKESDRIKQSLENMTFINNSNCLLFTRGVIFHVLNLTDPQKPISYTYTMPPFLANTTGREQQSTCVNYSQTYVMEYDLKKTGRSISGRDSLSLTKLKLVVSMKLNRPMGWWGLDSIEVTADGTVFQPDASYNKFINGSDVEGYVEGPVGFGYACGKQRQLYLPTTASAPKEKADEKTGAKAEPADKPKIRYSISFKDLQVQPFEVKTHKKKKPLFFTDDVFDCVPFISIAVWMFLVCAAVLLVIVFCGIAMISSLKTMDRFDDPKQKGLVINVKE